MKKHIFFGPLSIIITLLILLSCNGKSLSSSGIENSRIETIKYYYNHNQYILIEKKDSLIQALTCSVNDTGFHRFEGKREVKGFTIENPNETESSDEFNSVISKLVSNEHTDFKEIDSTTFWNQIEPLLNLVTFDLSSEWKLLDQTYFNKSLPHPRIPIDRLEIRNRTFSRLETPSVSYEIIVNKEGKIIDTFYYPSFGKKALKGVIDEVETVLLTRSIPFFSVFGKPVKVKLRITAYVTDHVT